MQTIMGAKRSRPVRRAPVVENNEDTALRSLSKEDREKLAMDSWEPSLLRNLLKAENRLPRKR
jgi:hypothetical protein